MRSWRRSPRTATRRAPAPRCRPRLAVDPGRRGQGLGAWLVDRLDRLVADHADELPFTVRALAPSVDDRGRRAPRVAWVRTRPGEPRDGDRARRPPRERPLAPPGVTSATLRGGQGRAHGLGDARDGVRRPFRLHAPPYEVWAGVWYGADDWDPRTSSSRRSEGAAVGHIAWVDAVADGYIVECRCCRSVSGTWDRDGAPGARLRRHRRGRQGARHTRRRRRERDRRGRSVRSVGMVPLRESHMFERAAGERVRCPRVPGAPGRPDADLARRLAAAARRATESTSGI